MLTTVVFTAAIALGAQGQSDAPPASAPPMAPDAPAVPVGPAPTAEAPGAQPVAPAAPAATAAPSPSPPALSERPRNVLSLNVPSNVFGAYSLEYERVFTSHVGMFVEPTFFNIPAQEGFSLGIRGPGLVAGAKLYPFGEAPDGLFIAPELYLTFLDSLGDTTGADLGLGTGAVAGWAWRFWDHLHVSLGLGGTVNVLGMNLAGSQGFGFLPVIRANVGGAF